jgi:ubiquitin carboxyl-terminal hydrolase 14
MAQQDAEECWSQIISILRTNVKNPDQQKSFIDTYMAGVMTSTLSCDESTDEPVVNATESFLKLACHIGITTNFMRDGILAALSEKIEKRSEILDRNAGWTKTSRVSRLPKYLVVHFVRFYWKRDTNKKAKILRKVKFPMELDATEYCTDELKKKTLPVRDALREARHKQEEKERQRKRARHDVEVRTAVVGTDVLGPADFARMVVPDEPEEPTVDPETLIDAELKADVGSNPTGLYELAGVLTHAGSNADSGHWQGWTKQAEGGTSWIFCMLI